MALHEFLDPAEHTKTVRAGDEYTAGDETSRPTRVSAKRAHATNLSTGNSPSAMPEVPQLYAYTLVSIAEGLP